MMLGAIVGATIVIYIFGACFVTFFGLVSGAGIVALFIGITWPLSLTWLKLSTTWANRKHQK